LFNPLLPDIKTAGVPSYWWVIDQCEYATDMLFTDRAALATILDDLVTASVTMLGASDVMHCLGRKLHHAFDGEVTIDSKKRREFRLKANAVKFCDHANVFRVETTINNPREFKVLRSPPEGSDQQPRWCPMTKGVANFWRYAEVAHAANDAADAKRRTHRTSRLISKLRGHRFITKVKNSRLYRLTARGAKAMGAAVRFRQTDFPTHFRELQAALAG